MHSVLTSLLPRKRTFRVSGIRAIVWLFCLLLFFTLTGPELQAKPLVLEKTPVASPKRQYYANVEWEDVGFIGILRMKIWDQSGHPLRMVELPEINPEPANLLWIDQEWIACESFIGNNGSGFFYVHAPTGRGYLLEIVQPRPNADWLFTVSTNDSVSSEAIPNVSRAHSSLFPVVLRDAPDREVDYFTPAFARSLSEAADAFNEFRRQRRFTEFDLLSDADINPQYGGIVIASVDDFPLVVYFPVDPQMSARQVLQHVRSQPLSEQARKVLEAPDAPEPHVRWLKDGEFVVEASSSDTSTTSPETTASVLMSGRFDPEGGTTSSATTTSSASETTSALPAEAKKQKGPIVVEVKPASASHASHTSKPKSSRKRR